MTFADLLTDVEHAKAKATAAGIAFHTIQVKVEVLNRVQAEALDLYSGGLSTVTSILKFEAE